MCIRDSVGSEMCIRDRDTHRWRYRPGEIFQVGKPAVFGR
jgi:hypothetical protein